MKVPNVIIKPPSLVSRLEGKSNKALIQKIEENNQKILEEKKDSNDTDKSQHLVDLLV